MNIAVIDDDKAITQQIKIILKQFADSKKVQINISLFLSGEEFLSSYKPNDFNIILIDIYMDKMSGIDTAKAIREYDSNCLIIFLTTSLEHMQDAFSCHAFEYIIKPVNSERIFEVMNDALDFIPSLTKYIEITCKRKKLILFLSEIVSVISRGHYLLITDNKNNEYSVRMTLSEFINLLQNDTRFLTINKGVLVNMDYIDTIVDNHCILTDNQRFPIKIRESALITQMWHDYNFEQIRSGQKNEKRRNIT